MVRIQLLGPVSHLLVAHIPFQRARIPVRSFHTAVINAHLPDLPRAAAGPMVQPPVNKDRATDPSAQRDS